MRQRYAEWAAEIARIYNKEDLTGPARSEKKGGAGGALIG